MSSDTASIEARQAALLVQGLAALQVSASDAQQARLLEYLRLLQRWNAAYNLSAVRDPLRMVTQHLLDCLAIVPALNRRFGGAALRILDVGSGGGLPGVVLAVMQPSWTVCCVDAVAKKAFFLRQVAAELQLKNLQAEHARVEALRATPFDLVVSRAFSSLMDFVALTRSQLASGGVWLAMKGRAPSEEIGALPGDVEVFHVEQLEVPGLGAQRCLVWMRQRQKLG
jgi:16S rRNA (guanine527-N7)-methyltransferase